MRLNCAGRGLDLTCPAVMGVLNVTDNSFSDGGRYQSLEAAVAHGMAMVAAGASIIDIGGESTRPGAQSVPLQEELDRVLPVIEALAVRVDAVISIDTMKPAVMTAAVSAGAGMVNDVHALQAPGALEAVAATSAAICLMHMQGTPRTMQENPHYDDVVAEVAAFLDQRAAACVDAGIGADRIALDPGFGFGKSMEHNLQLPGRIAAYHRRPVSGAHRPVTQIHAGEVDRPTGVRAPGRQPRPAQHRYLAWRAYHPRA